jgi:protoheme IX farnesyltransferase
MEVMKVRLISAELLLAIATLFMAGGTHVPLNLFLYLLIFGFLGLAGSATLNSYIDRDIDAMMSRTADRPIPAGRIKAVHALIMGITMVAAGVAGSALLINYLTATIIGLGSALYLLLYTMVVKRNTPAAVILGGFAGAIPAYGGWAAYGGANYIIPTIVFLIVFFWQPAHFWYLATFYSEDYRSADIPVLPVLMGRRGVMKRALAYNLAVIALTYLLAFEFSLSPAFLAALTLINALLLFFSIRTLYSVNMHTFRTAFHYTVSYMVLFLIILIALSLTRTAYILRL